MGLPTATPESIWTENTYTECNEIANQIPWEVVDPGTITIIYGSLILQSSTVLSRSSLIPRVGKEKHPSISILYQKHQYENIINLLIYPNHHRRKHTTQRFKTSPPLSCDRMPIVISLV